MKSMGKRKGKSVLIAYGSLLLCAVILLLFYLVFIRTLHERVQQQEWEHSLVSGNYARLQAELAEKYGQQDASRLRELIARLPVQADTSLLVRALASLEADTGLVIESITFAAGTTTRTKEDQADSLLDLLKNGWAAGKDKRPQDQFPLPSVDLQVQFSGTVTQLQRFLARIDRMERIVVIEGFEYRYENDVDRRPVEVEIVDAERIRGQVSLKALYADQFRDFVGSR